MMGRSRANVEGGAKSSGPGSAEPASGSESSSFEQAAARLAQIVELLESGELPLEQSLGLFEEGVRVARAAQKRLDEAERRVEELVGVGPDGAPVTRDLEG